MNDDFVHSLSKEINKDLGDEISFLLEDGSPSDVKDWISTGSTLLDTIISNQTPGGVPVGKITEISGLEGTGKTLFAMQICACAQKAGAFVIFIDTENAFNTDFAKRVGLDASKNFMYTTPACVEDAFAVIFKTLSKLSDYEKKGKDAPYKYILIVWDSVAATPCKVDVATENPDPTATIGLKPRILSKNINTLLKSTGRKNVAFFIVNQLRTVINARPFTDPYTTPGGKAIPFAASARLRITAGGKIKIGKEGEEEVVGVSVSVKVVKTRFGPPFRSVKMPLYFSHGIDDVESMIEYAMDSGILGTKSGGPKGKLFFFKDDGSETGINRKDFKTKILKDEKTKDRLKKLCTDSLTKDLVNPENEELTIDKDTTDLS